MGYAVPHSPFLIEHKNITNFGMMLLFHLSTQHFARKLTDLPLYANHHVIHGLHKQSLEGACTQQGPLTCMPTTVARYPDVWALKRFDAPSSKSIPVEPRRPYMAE